MFNLKVLRQKVKPFAEQHDWEPTRYAGVFTYLMTLIHLNDWLRMVVLFGNETWIVVLFDGDMTIQDPVDESKSSVA